MEVPQGGQTFLEQRRDRTQIHRIIETSSFGLGYMLMQQKKLPEAIAILKTNAEFYPKSSNVYDSLGDAYVKDVATGDLTLVSTSDSGVKGNGISGLHLGISRTGNRVVFMSVANNLKTDAEVKDALEKAF